ncbi:MAG TPA: SpoIIE family protein phosphatase [Dongiaceae bacterium]|jgi:sigma-B regulation protein RsbU (phosphoserine phosphatase)|nr:SpoIIE family protein phosphatase [Dongiaceae bacterium]
MTDIRTSTADALSLAAVISRSFAASLNIERTTRAVLEQIVSALAAQAGALFLFDEEERQLICRASVGPASVEGMALPRGEGVVGRAAATDSVIAVHEAYTDEIFSSRLDAQTGFKTTSLLCAPLRAGDRVLGAVEIVNKRTQARFDAQDEALLRVAASAAALAISHARLAEQLIAQEGLKREVELAARIQQSLLPPIDPDLPLRGVNLPARQVSGDFFDYFALPDGRITFALGDVSGKGVNAALLMAKTASLLRCLGKAVSDPGRLLSLVNREICDTQAEGMFVTCIVGYIDPERREICLANAGHLPALFWTPDGKIRYLPAEAPPLGLLADAYFEPEIHPTLDGQLLLYTDGLSEASLQPGHENELGIDGVAALFARVADRPLDTRLSEILHGAGLTAENVRDDATLLLLDTASLPVRVREDEPASDQHVHLTINADPKNLRLVRGLVLAAAQGFPATEIDDILVAVSEALENIMLHGYRGDRQGRIDIQIIPQPDGMVFRLRDYAPPIDTAKIKPRALDDIRPGGLGTHFIAHVMDRISYLPAPGGRGNILELVKRRPHK